jgi:RNA polymerase sigma factor (sigma-70 family)
VADATDTELLTRWRQGDGRAGSELARRHFVAIRTYFVNKVSVAHEDLVQETFTRMLSHSHRFRGDSSFKVYLFGFARLVLLEHFRARQRDQRIEPMATSGIDLGGTGASSLLGEREQHRLLLDALRRLELRDQELLELYYWQDLSAREIAEHQGVPEPTVRGRVRAALKRLARHYEERSQQPHERELDEQALEGLLAELRTRLGLSDPDPDPD